MGLWRFRGRWRGWGVGCGSVAGPRERCGWVARRERRGRSGGRVELGAVSIVEAVGV